MNTTELYTLFRSDMDDVNAPYLWSDDDVFGYIGDAQTMFCRKTDGISDVTTPAVTQLAITPGAGRITTHKSVLKIRTATRLDTGRSVEVVNREDMAKRNWYFDGTQGPIKALVVGEEAHSVRTYPVSNETVNIELMVFRLPMVAITTDGEQEFEIDEQHHRHLLLWCKHLAYSKQDAETIDKNKAAEFEQKFNAYCETAKEEARRARHKPRLVAYGGL